MSTRKKKATARRSRGAPVPSATTFLSSIKENQEESVQKKQKLWAEQVFKSPSLPTAVHRGSYPNASDDYVLTLVQRVYDEFVRSCACTLLSFWRPKRRTLWHVNAKSVMQLRDTVELFVSGPGGHAMRREYFMQIVRECHELPPSLDTNGIAARMFKTYVPKMQFMMVFSVPFTANQVSRRGLAKGSRRNIAMEVILPMTDTNWDEDVHRCLPPPTKKRIDTVLQVIQESRADCTSPFLAMPTDVLKNIFSYMVEDDPDVTTMVEEHAKCTRRALNAK